MNTIKFQGTESIHKTLVFLCTNNKLVGKKKKQLRKQFCLQSLRYLGINLTKEVKDLYVENCKTLLKKLKETQ